MFSIQTDVRPSTPSPLPISLLDGSLSTKGTRGILTKRGFMRRRLEASLATTHAPSTTYECWYWSQLCFCSGSRLMLQFWNCSCISCDDTASCRVPGFRVKEGLSCMFSRKHLRRKARNLAIHWLINQVYDAVVFSHSLQVKTTLFFTTRAALTKKYAWSVSLKSIWGWHSTS